MGEIAFGYLSERGNRANEDFVYAEDSFGVLLDGASGMGGANHFSETNLTEAQWFSNAFGTRVSALLSEGVSVPDALARASASVLHDFENACDIEQLDVFEMPSATISIVTVGDDVVDVWWLGDSPIAVLTDRGIDCLLDTRIGELDALALDEATRRRSARGTSDCAGSDLVSDILRKNRSLMNTDGGYFILEPRGEGLARISHHSYERGSVRAILAGSDGLFAAFDVYGIISLPEMLEDVSLAALRGVINRMRVVEEADPALERYPRLKQGDDASAFFFVL